jgi:DmsE family decaheme c-type cytochrome
MLKQNSINENCYSCHTERRGPFLWEHPPVFENCALCHDPHGSVNDRLLKVSDPRVCNSCHMVGSHPVTPRPGKVTPIPGNRTRNFEPSVFFFNRSCTNCHSQVHGSNHPGGVFFTR